MRSSTIIAISMLAFGALLPAACTQDFNVFGSNGGSGGQPSSSSSSSSSSSASSSGSTGCKTDGECDDQNPCTADTCNTTTGKCVNEGTNGAVPGYTDTVKDCKSDKCVNGVQTPQPNDADVPDNTNPCVSVTCSNGDVKTVNVSSGTNCGNNPPQTCDGQGNCVGCNMDNDCPQVGACQTRNCDSNHVCSPIDKSAGTSCSGGGGNVCDDMGNCVECNDKGDCPGAGPTTICSNHHCISSCGDGTKDGTESDKDCGGACSGCPNGKMCGSGADCQSTFCNNGTCAGAPNGHTCTSDGQCSSSHCVGGICCSGSCNGTCVACTMALTGKPDGTCDNITAGKTAPAGQCTASTCGNDGKCDGSGACEQVASGTVCGAAACVGNVFHSQQTCASGMCPNGTTTDCGTYKCKTSGCPTSCAADGDCATGNYCQTPGATGMCVAQVADGMACTGNNQCTSGFCASTSGNCEPATCNNNMKDGTETGTDCGGTTCSARCGANGGCQATSDCQSGLTCNTGAHKCQ